MRNGLRTGFKCMREFFPLHHAHGEGFSKLCQQFDLPLAFFGADK